MLFSAGLALALVLALALPAVVLSQNVPRCGAVSQYCPTNVTMAAPDPNTLWYATSFSPCSGTGSLASFDLLT